MTPEENRQRTLAVGNQRFGSVGSHLRPSKLQYRRPPALSVMDVLARDNPKLVPNNYSGRKPLGPMSQAANPNVARGNIQTVSGRPLGNIIDNGNAKNRKLNQKFFGRDNMFGAEEQTPLPDDQYADDFLGTGDQPAKGQAWDTLGAMGREFAKDFNSDANPLTRPMRDWDVKGTVGDYLSGVHERVVGMKRNPSVVGLGADGQPIGLDEVPNASLPTTQNQAVAQPTRQAIPSDINDMSSYNHMMEDGTAPISSPERRDPSRVYTADGSGWMSKLTGNNEGGISNNDVARNLIDSRAGLTAPRSNPYQPQQEAIGQGGIDASSIMSHLRTPVATGDIDQFGNDIMRNPKSARLDSALDFNYNRDSKRASRFDDLRASGMSHEEAQADMTNSQRTFRDRAMRLKENSAKDAKAIANVKAGQDQQKIDTQRFAAEKTAEFEGDKAGMYPAQAKYWTAYAKQLDGKNDAAVKIALDKSFFEAMTEISKMMDGPEKDLAREEMYALKQGKRVRVTKQATEGRKAGIIRSAIPPTPAEFETYTPGD